ncbi:MAG: long-chain fatty acid--CoA ligase [Deltaproteobacteria bacterium]|nr:long-chain fatty acid--CoA ligase [Deltaproteobacteria bacterium]MCF8119279.1 long-chain fatty acid--CoA ligase [Deltaproteobacteria bacterium]
MDVGYLLTNSAHKFPDRLAVIGDEGRYTFRTFDQRTDRLASAMVKTGLEKGDRVAILFFNGIHFAETYFAAVKVGLVATPINFRLAVPEILYLINNSQSKILFYDPAFEARLKAVQSEMAAVRWFVSPHSGNPSMATDYEAFAARGKEAFFSLPRLNEEDPCQLMYTSGTTGQPKGAVLTHGNIIWNLFNTISGRDDQPGERAVIVGPLFHTAALNNHFTIQVALGGTSILVRKFEPASLLETIQTERATVMSGAPALYNMLISHPNARAFDVSSITKCTAGADKLPMETKERIMDFFPNIQGVYDVYGCTEASPCVTILKAKDSMRKDMSVGKALPFLDACIVDGDDAPLPPGRVGEIVCRGANVMEGYHEDPEATRAALRNGWLHTGDLARMDDEGFFYIVDRKKDMIVSGGENIYPREIENVLIGHPAIADVAVVGIPDREWGESVQAFVVLEAGQHLDEQGVIDFCREFLAGYKKPKSVVFVDSIPKNALGKVLKRVLKETRNPPVAGDDSVKRR